MEKITKLKMLKQKIKVTKKYNNNNNNNNNNSDSMMIQKKLKLFHFDNSALIITLLLRKVPLKIFLFPKYILYSHQELICHLRKNKLDSHKGKYD